MILIVWKCDVYQMTKIIRKVYGLFVHAGVLHYVRKVQIL